MRTRKTCLPAVLTILGAAITVAIGRYLLQVNLEGTGWLAGVVGFGLMLSFALVTLLLLAATIYCWRIRRQDSSAAQDELA